MCVCPHLRQTGTYHIHTGEQAGVSPLNHPSCCLQEHVTGEWKDDNPLLHNKLVELYLDEVLYRAQLGNADGVGEGVAVSPCSTDG